ncbi:MAG: ribokinase [Hyphomicrobiaceae bacterium]
MSVTVFGSINIDVTAYAERIPAIGETLHGTAYKTGLGGKGANQAVAAARLGVPTAFVGRVGGDGFADEAARQIAGYGVDAGLLLRDRDAATGIAVIGVDAEGRNVIWVIAGANGRLDATDVERAQPQLARSKVLLLQIEVPLESSLAAAAVTRAAGGLVVLDPAPVPPSGVADQVYTAVDILTPNEVETGMLLGTTPRTADDALSSARALRARGARTAIVKMGALGAAYSGPEGEAFVPAFKVQAVDTVAAGDCFNGGLAAGLAQGLSLAEAMRMASATGALATTRQGSAEAAPTLAEVRKLLGGS